MGVEADLLGMLRDDKEVIKRVIDSITDEDYLDNLIDLATKNKISSNVINILASERNEQEDNISYKFKEIKKKNNEIIYNQLETIDCMKEVFDGFNVIWIKGIPLSVKIYGDMWLRKSGDIDLLVKTGDIDDIVDILCNKGFKKVGVINEDIGRRFSYYYHEIQLMSPYNVLVEIKCISGEVEIIDNYKNLIDVFWENTEEVVIGNKKINTLNTMYTLIHLFLSALSNSLAWHDMRSNGLRDVLEIHYLVTNNNIDYNNLFYVADNYGFSYMVWGIMKKANKIWKGCFKDEVIEMFEHPNYKQHPMSELYKAFLEYYDLDITDELFDKKKKANKYYEALSRTYYQNDAIFKENHLDKNLLEYSIKNENGKIRLDVSVADKICSSNDENVIILKLLASDEEIIKKYGYIFVFWLKLKDGEESAFLMNEPGTDEYQKFYEIVESSEKKKIDDRVTYTYYINSMYIDKNKEKICYNVQLVTQNKNDNNNYFDISVLHPQKNTLPAFHTEWFKDVLKSKGA